ncbi:MAG: hypothetical protein ACKOXK_07680 [Chakrabartia sp.]
MGEPDEQSMRQAYLETDDVRLGSELLGGALALAEFRKVGCSAAGKGMFRCKFFSKFSTETGNSEGGKLLSNIVSSQTASFREAVFFKNDAGQWLCTEVTLIQS